MTSTIEDALRKSGLLAAAPNNVTEKRPHMKKALVAGGPRAFVFERIAANLRSVGIEVTAHWDMQRGAHRNQATARNVDVVIVLTDMEGHHMDRDATNAARLMDIPFVRTARKWSTMLSDLQRQLPSWNLMDRSEIVSHLGHAPVLVTAPMPRVVADPVKVTAPVTVPMTKEASKMKESTTDISKDPTITFQEIAEKSGVPLVTIYHRGYDEGICQLPINRGKSQGDKVVPVSAYARLARPYIPPSAAYIEARKRSRSGPPSKKPEEKVAEVKPVLEVLGPPAEKISFEERVLMLEETVRALVAEHNVVSIDVNFTSEEVSIEQRVVQSHKLSFRPAEMK